MKTILLWDPRFPDRRPARLTVEDTVASAAVRAGVAAAANPAEAGALAAGGALDSTMLTEVVLQHGNGGAVRRVFLPYSVVLVGALAGALASIGTPISGGVTPTPTPSVPTIAFGTTSISIAEGDSGTKTVANVINVTRNGVTGPLTVNLTYAGTATSGTDYVAGPVSGTIADGQSSLSFDLTINGDTGIEADETIVINAVLAAYSSATASKTITVTNDDVTGTPTPSALAFTGSPSPTTTGRAYSFAPEASGGSGSKIYAFGGNTLGGTFNTATGELTGPFTSAGTIAGSVTVTDASGSAAVDVSIPVAVGPNAIANLLLDLDAAEIFSLSPTLGPVATAMDASGGALTATQPILGFRPTSGLRRINNRNALDFAGTSSPGTSFGVNVPHGGGYTIFMVVQVDTLSQAKILFNGPTGALAMRIATTGIVQVLRQGSVALQNGNTPIARGVPQLLTIQAGAFGTRIRINGTADASNTADAALTQPITSLGGLTSPLDGALAGFIAYSGDMASADLAAMEASLMAKWLTAPAARPVSPITSKNGRIFTWGNGEQLAWAA